MDMSSKPLHSVPLTLEGSAVLHQMFRIKWLAWNALDQAKRSETVREAQQVLGGMENDSASSSALFSMLGHKCDLMLVHFRASFDDLNQAELAIAKTKLAEYLEQTTSYVSVVELGLYDSSVKVYTTFRDKDTKPHSPEWNAAIDETVNRQTEAMKSRLFPTIPPNRYICFYPMDRKRGEHKNWYRLPIEERNRQMQEHGEVGRRYAGTVKQIITGSIGFDDWEWGVDLFADEPLVFKKLIYEMRFDEVSADYALFGQFYVGMRVPAAKLGELLDGKLPK